MTGRVLFLVPAGTPGSATGVDRDAGGDPWALAPVAGVPLVARAIRSARRAARILGDPQPVVVCSTGDARVGAVATEWHAEVVEGGAGARGASRRLAETAREV